MAGEEEYPPKELFHKCEPVLESRAKKDPQLSSGNFEPTKTFPS